MHALLDSAELGELRQVEAHITMPAPPDDDPRWSFELAGGAVMDLGCYGLHAHRTLARWAGGEPRVVGARGEERAGHPGVDEWLEVHLAYPGGATGYMRCSMNDDWRVTLRLVGSAGEAIAANFALPHRDDTIWVRSGGEGRTEALGTRSSFIYQLEALRAQLRGAGPADPLFPDAEDAVLTAELIDAAYLAAGFTPRPGIGL
jgi:predicted dehydrogenase